jgi:hypothetical protein
VTQAVSTSYGESLGRIPTLKKANGGKEVTVSVDLEVVSVPDADDVACRI